MNIARSEIVAAIAVALAFFHIFISGVTLDSVALILLALAGVVFLMPELSEIFARIRKIKIGEFEAEFDVEIRKLEEKVLTAESQVSSKKIVDTIKHISSKLQVPQLHRDYVREYKNILASSSSNTQKIVLSSILVDRMIQETVTALELDSSGTMPAKEGMLVLLKEGFVAEAETEAFKEFWSVRNIAVHGNRAEEITDRQTARVLDLLWRMVKIFG